jgi:nucleoside-diphosphate-sugar epimerase
VRALITGVSGFAGGHLALACAAAGDDVIGVSRSGEVSAGEGRPVDLRDPAATREAVREDRRDVVYHLAALSAMGRSCARARLRGSPRSRHGGKRGPRNLNSGPGPHGQSPA